LLFVAREPLPSWAKALNVVVAGFTLALLFLVIRQP
jgi:hypothetical protein